jgi:hypothetical protein
MVEATKGYKVSTMKGSFSTIIVAWFLVLVFGSGSLEGSSLGVRGDTLEGNCQKVWVS